MTRSCTFFMLLEATAHWRDLDADAQRDLFDDASATVFNGYPDLRMSRYASGAFHDRCSDVLVWQTSGDLSQYHAAIDTLRAQPFFGAPLFEIIDVVPGIEDDGDAGDEPGFALEAFCSGSAL